MFTFINTTILAFIFAIAIPLLIHLFNKRRKKKIKFSSIRFLQLLEKQRLKRIKIYDYLLILIRTLIILTLVLAFARPTVKSKSFLSAKNARTTSVIILDTGINMSRYDEKGSLYIRAQSILTRLIEKFNSEDEIYIIRSGSPNKISNLQSALSEPNVSYVHGKWSTAFKEAKKLFAEHPNFNQELHIISDFQFHEETFNSQFADLSTVRVYLIQIGSETVSNTGIKNVEIKNQIFEANKPIQLDAQIISLTPDEVEPVEIHLFINQQRVAHQNISIEPMMTKSIPLSFSPKSPGNLSGYVEINDDDLLADNRYYFALNIPAVIKLLYVDDLPSVFLKAALTSLADQSNVQVTVERYNSWARQNLLNYDVVALSNLSELNTAGANRLRKYLEDGGALVLIPGISTTPKDFNKFASSIGLSVMIKNLMRSADRNEFFNLKQPNLSHPLFSGLFRTREPEIVKPKFYQYFKLSSSERDQTILAYQNNDPFLMQADHEKGSAFILASYIDDDWTDIQYRGIFLPLLSRIIHFSASYASQLQTSTIVETEKTISLNYLSQSGEFYLRSPDGDKNRIVPKQVDQNLQFQLNILKLPGLYQIVSGNETIVSIPANAETFAIHKSPIDLDLVRENENVNLFYEDDDFEDAVIEARFGFELWKFLIILTLLLLGIELYLIKKMEGKGKQQK